MDFGLWELIMIWGQQRVIKTVGTGATKRLHKLWNEYSVYRLYGNMHSSLLLSYFIKTMTNHILHVLQQHGDIMGPGAKLSCLQSRPVTHWQHLAHCEVKCMTKEALNCWVAEIPYQARIGKHFAFKTKSVLSSVPKQLYSVVKTRGDATQW